jgi:hypothetical protein
MFSVISIDHEGDIECWYLSNIPMCRIEDYPNLQFTIIVNPHNGPGSSALPDAQYSQEIPKLNAHANVCTLGYVSTRWCQRDQSEVLQDIATYAGWSKEHGTSELAVHGIFFDETPNQYSAEVGAYLTSIDNTVKETSGILGDRLVS